MSGFRPAALSWFLPLLLAACATGQDLMLQGDARNITMVVDATSDSGMQTKALTAVIGRVSPSFITLVIRKPRDTAHEGFGQARKLTSGSGFFIDRQGHALTAGHVAVLPGLRASARAADGRIHEGEVVAVSRVPDAGLIRFAGVTSKPVLPAASPCLPKGAPVFSLGRPRKGRETARVGTVVSMRFKGPVRYGRFGYDEAIMVRMNTHRGESGGPLFNARGELVGMIVSTLSRGGQPLYLAHALPLPVLVRI